MDHCTLYLPLKLNNNLYGVNDISLMDFEDHFVIITQTLINYSYRNIDLQQFIFKLLLSFSNISVFLKYCHVQIIML